MSSPALTTDIPNTVGPPETGVFGVGAGVSVAVTVQPQVASVEQEGLRHAPSTQESPEAQSAFTVHVLLQLAF
jgi:hypothetical protein